MIDFKGSQFERDIILWGIRWYVAYPISYRQLEEMMPDRGVTVDHSSLNRWVLKYTQLLDKAFRQWQALGGHELAHGRDVHQRQRAVEIFVSSRR